MTIFLLSGENVGLEPKYLKKREDSIPLRGLSQNLFSTAGEAFRVRPCGGRAGARGWREAKSPCLPHCRPSERWPARSAADSLQTRLGPSLLGVLPRAAAAQLTAPSAAWAGTAWWRNCGRAGPSRTQEQRQSCQARQPAVRISVLLLLLPLCLPAGGSEEPRGLGDLGTGGPESVPGSGVWTRCFTDSSGVFLNSAWPARTRSQARVDGYRGVLITVTPW